MRFMIPFWAVAPKSMPLISRICTKARALRTSESPMAISSPPMANGGIFNGQFP
jgi:hypothetical protein